MNNIVRSVLLSASILASGYNGIALADDAAKTQNPAAAPQQSDGRMGILDAYCAEPGTENTSCPRGCTTNCQGTCKTGFCTPPPK